MSVFKCKMCGGTVEFEPGATVGVCDSCGTKQTLPRLDDDRRANLYDRANHFRRNNDFDKAMGIYEQILNADNADAEAYWSLVLCRYGIEYVEDPATRKRVPTVNRAQYTSIFADEDYKSALQYADSYQKEIYEQEAKAIDDIQKGILEISSKEKPFDVFICYKETDAQGRRTQDSVLANDLYHQLTQEGFKVFFSRITLEDKLGTAYEPYIFAALNSAKVMVVLGTKPEYFNAVWVKNEWSRYLSIVKQSGGKKVLIPAYRDMDPYDLPEEFSHLQAQDMSKLGFMQDLIRGIKKIVGTSNAKAVVKESVAVNTTNNSTAPLLRRAYLFLEDGNWQEADEYCERVLDLDPECAEAYVGKLMAELKVRKRDKLADCREPFESLNNCQKAIRFGDKRLIEEIEGYVRHIYERNENERLTTLYNEATDIMKRARTQSAFKDAAATFRLASGFKDADELAVICDDKASLAFKEELYNSALNRMKGKTVDGYEQAIGYFKQLSGWKDSEAQIAICENEIAEIEAKAKAEQEESRRRAEENRIKAEKRRKKIISISIPIVAVCVVFCIVLIVVIIPLQKLNQYVDLLNTHKSPEAAALWGEIKDSNIVQGNLHRKAKEMIDEERYDTAYLLLTEAGDEEAIEANKYDRALKFIGSGNYYNAYNLLKDLNYTDSKSKADEISGPYLQEAIKKAEEGESVFFGSYEQDNNPDNGKEKIEWIVLKKEDNSALLISKNILECLSYNTKDSTDTTWENSFLRYWLNDDFYNEVFSTNQQKMISLSDVPGQRNPKSGKSGGNGTKDHVFLLSIPEVRKYLDKYYGKSQANVCKLTESAAASLTQAHYKNNDDYTWPWWTRTPGRDLSRAAFIRRTGEIDYDGAAVTHNYEGVRPAMWIDISDAEG